MMEGLFFIFSKYRVTKGFKFHARPQTGAYSCYYYVTDVPFFSGQNSDQLGEPSIEVIKSLIEV